MVSDAEKILRAKVSQIDSFQWNSTQWEADFHLEGGQGFHVCYDGNGYLYTPDSKDNLLPELKQISWMGYKMGFGGRGCGLITTVELTDSSAEADKKVYEQILTPSEIDEGRWVPYPSYKYVPMLSTAFKIRSAWADREKITRISKMAEQNMQDVLSLKEKTYDLRQYT